MLSREIRSYTAAMLQPNLPPDKADLLASLIEEEDWTASLGETLYQIARRVERQPFSRGGQGTGQRHARPGRRRRCGRSCPTAAARPVSAKAPHREPVLQQLRERCLKLGAELPWAERGAILTLLGSAERAFYLIERIDAERRSVPRPVVAAAPASRDAAAVPGGGAGSGVRESTS